jgi:hypothetical protein
MECDPRNTSSWGRKVVSGPNPTKRLPQLAAVQLSLCSQPQLLPAEEAADQRGLDLQDSPMLQRPNNFAALGTRHFMQPTLPSTA